MCPPQDKMVSPKDPDDEHADRDRTPPHIADLFKSIFTARITILLEEQENIRNSLGYKFLTACYKIVDVLFPVDGNRRKFIEEFDTAWISPRIYLRRCRRLALEISNRLFPLGARSLPLVEFPRFSSVTVSIIILAFNKFRYTYRCLESVRKNTIGVPYEVIVVDNASTDQTPEMLSKFRNLKVVRNDRNLGFVLGNNGGAEAAEGEFLLFLNNDTEVTPDWLAPMLLLVQSQPDAGIVGPMLVYPDGRLQEAGGIVWNKERDLAWNYGSGDDLEKPQYNYVKEVDYCSGACLLIPKRLFQQVGAFSKDFAPNYYEDTDLAFKIRGLGYKVVYQPRSKIIHFEGVTSGGNLGKGMKRYQAINEPVFRGKWQAVLAREHVSGPEELFKARDRSQLKKTILVVDHRVPQIDMNAGDYIVAQYIQTFLALGWKVIFWPHDMLRVEPYTSQMQDMGVEVMYGDMTFWAFARSYAKYLDVALLARPSSIYYAEALRCFSSVKIIYFCHDLHHVREARRAAIEHSAELLSKSERTKLEEYYMILQSDTTVVVSRAEKEMLERACPWVDAVVWPWVQAPLQMEREHHRSPNLVFIGGFEHRPNEDAVMWFAREVMPIIEHPFPEARFIIIGSKPTKAVLELACHNVDVVGYVQDVSPYFMEASVFVAPLRYGAGFKGKTALAMSYGLPVVTTSIGAEGMGLEHGENALIADDPKEFASLVCELLANRDLWTELSRNSIRFLQARCSPELAENAVAATLSALRGPHC